MLYFWTSDFWVKARSFIYVFDLYGLNKCGLLYFSETWLVLPIFGPKVLIDKSLIYSDFSFFSISILYFIDWFFGHLSWRVFVVSRKFFFLKCMTMWLVTNLITFGQMEIGMQVGNIGKAQNFLHGSIMIGMYVPENHVISLFLYNFVGCSNSSYPTYHSSA